MRRQSLVELNPALIYLVPENEEAFSIVFPNQISSIEGGFTGQVSDDETIINMKYN